MRASERAAERENIKMINLRADNRSTRDELLRVQLVEKKKPTRKENSSS